MFKTFNQFIKESAVINNADMLNDFYKDLYQMLAQETHFDVMKTFKEPISAYASEINTNVWSDFCVKYNFELSDVDIDDDVTIVDYSPEGFYLEFATPDGVCSVEGYSNDEDEPIFIAALISHEDNQRDSDSVIAYVADALSQYAE